MQEHKRHRHFSFLRSKCTRCARTLNIHVLLRFIILLYLEMSAVAVTRTNPGKGTMIPEGFSCLSVRYKEERDKGALLATRMAFNMSLHRACTSQRHIETGRILQW